MTHNYKRYMGESDDELIFRVTGEKEQIGTWQDVADILNDLLGTDYNESAFRKKRQTFDRMLSANQSKFVDTSTQLEELRKERQLLEKEKVKFRDERNEYNRLIRREARKESFEEMIKRIICENTEAKTPFKQIPLYSHSDNDLLCHLTDVHAGIYINNWKNKFDEHVLQQRIETYMNNIIEVAQTHNSENCYMVIGEILSGIIHNNLRLQNNMDLMQQFKYISGIISEMLSTLSDYFKGIYVYVTPGNHSRISPKKEDSLDGENMDVLLPFYLKARLQNYTNIVICDNAIDPEIAMFSIRGKTVMASHGHKDSPATVVQNFTMIYNIKPDIVLLGHRHTNALTTVFDTKVIQSGCVSGTDEHTLGIRKANRPELTISVVDDKGLKCIYDIQLD